MMKEKITPEDLERVQLLHIVSKRGFKDLSLEKIKRLQFLVEKKIIVTTKRLADPK